MSTAAPLFPAVPPSPTPVHRPLLDRGAIALLDAQICAGDCGHAACDAMRTVVAYLSARPVPTATTAADLIQAVEALRPDRGAWSTDALVRDEAFVEAIAAIRALPAPVPAACLRHCDALGTPCDCHTDCATLSDVLPEVFCRVYPPDRYEPMLAAWHAWYVPSAWLWWGRALGAFLVSHPAPAVLSAVAPVPSPVPGGPS